MLEIESSDAVHLDPDDLDMKELFKHVAQVCLDNGSIISMDEIIRNSEDLLKLLGIKLDDFHGTIPMLFLKQVPHAADSNTCAYQAVVTSTIQVVQPIRQYGLNNLNDIQPSNTLTAIFYGPGNVGGKTYPTHPFEKLGIAVDAPVLSPCVFWMNADLKLKHGEVIWNWP